MELVSFAKEVLQNVAEYAASYQTGQSVLKYLDKGLWVVEKSARWGVPLEVEQDGSLPQEAVRPLPWILFLPLLLLLRITRESLSLFNLVLGKPPLRSADVVMFIQSKRRYIRALKYQGARVLRMRNSTSSQPTESIFAQLCSLLKFTMCFKRQSYNYGNNNTTQVSNNEEILVIKRDPRGRQEVSPATSSGESPMERLIEKMMIDLDADSDEDSSFVLTNTTTLSGEPIDSENEQSQNTAPDDTNEKKSLNESTLKYDREDDECTKVKCMDERLNDTLTESDWISYMDTEGSIKQNDSPTNAQSRPESSTPKEESQKLIQSEKCKPPKKIANGRPVKGVPSRKKAGSQAERRELGMPVVPSWHVTPPSPEQTSIVIQEAVRSPHHR